MKLYHGFSNGDVYVVEKKKKRKLEGCMTDDSGMGMAAWSILKDALADDARAARLHMRYKRRMLDSGLWGKEKNWTTSIAEIEKVLEDFGVTDRLVAAARRVREPPPLMSDRGPGFVWDNEPDNSRERK